MLRILGAVAISAALIIALGKGDPKRRRAVGLPGDGHSTHRRRLLAALACLPGVYCVLSGDAAAFMMWLGGCGVTGWLVTLGFGQSRKDAVR